MTQRWRIVAMERDPSGSRTVADISEFDSELTTRRGLLRSPMNRLVRDLLLGGFEVIITKVEPLQ